MTKPRTPRKKPAKGKPDGKKPISLMTSEELLLAIRVIHAYSAAQPSGEKPKKSKYYGAIVKCLDCGDTIQSKHVHDWVACKCYQEGNGTGIFVDGGGDYLRMGRCEDSRYEVVKEGKYLLD